jgi:predicted nucleic acid-binding protein|tara:strand:+ start:441 stop:851 length:411 start_codon:yes stop_codon:yes gene_type:complete
MTWVVDTCVVIDVLENDPSFGLRSATLLEQKLGDGLSICPVTFVELAPAFEGDLEQQEHFLEQAGIDSRCGWVAADTRTAYQAWHLHIAARRSGILQKRPIADVLIGAYASNRRGLITRNPRDFRRNFSDLKILEP